MVNFLDSLSSVRTVIQIYSINYSIIIIENIFIKKLTLGTTTPSFTNIHTIL